MSYALQCCTRCGALEKGHTGPADRYLCSTCRAAGWRQDSLGYVYQLTPYTVHTWDPVASEWSAQAPAVLAAHPRDAYLAARERHPGKCVHVARVLSEPCSPGERAHV